MSLTLQDMRAALKGQMRAEEAIFFFCLAWNSGAESDLYRIMVATEFHPRLHLQKQVENDPEILYCHEILKDLYEKASGIPLREFPLRPVKFADVKENDVLVHGPGRPFVCLEAGWPCRVYKWHGDLGVACAEDGHGSSFHPLKADMNGNIVGFRW